MMRKIFIIAAALAINFSAVAQMKFGVKAGGNVSYLSGWDMNDGRGTSGGSDFAIGLHAGGYANYSFSNLFGLQPEVIFSMQGGRDVHTWNETLRANYINVPLLLEIKPFKSPLSFLIGPQFGYCVSRAFDGAEFSVNKDLHNDFDFAIAWGLQYALTKHLTLGLRHNIGLTPSTEFDFAIVDEANPEDIYRGSVVGERNKVLHLSIGWTF